MSPPLGDNPATVGCVWVMGRWNKVGKGKKLGDRGLNGLGKKRWVREREWIRVERKKLRQI